MIKKEQENNIEVKEPTSYVISKNNKIELDFITEMMEQYIEEGGEILQPKVVSVNDLKGKFVDKGKESLGTILELKKEEKRFIEDLNSIYITFVIKPKVK